MISLPISASGTINIIVNFIAMMMVAQLGQKFLAAGALAISTYITIMTVTSTIFYSISILIGHSHGKDPSYQKSGLIVKNGLWCTLFLAFPAVLLLQYADHILILFGQDPQIVSITKNYFHYASIGILPLLMSTVIMQFFAATGRAKLIMLIAIIQLPINISIAYCFIFGKFGLPMLNLGGISCANFVVQTITVLVVITTLYCRDKKYQIFLKPWPPNKIICKEILYLGLPIGVQFGGEMGALSVATYFMGHFGIIALAALQVMNQYSIFIVMIKTGLTQAVSILTSKAYSKAAFGEDTTTVIKQYIYAAMLLLCGIFVVVIILFCVFPETLIKFYISEKHIDPQLIHLSVIFFRINTFILFIDGFRHLFSGALRGLHDSQAPMRIGVISLWCISLPLSYIIGFTLHGGPIGLRIGLAIGFTVATILLWNRLQKAHISHL